jgi:hypothetical protein
MPDMECPMTFTGSYFSTNDHRWCFRVRSQQGFFFPLLERAGVHPSSNARAAKGGDGVNTHERKDNNNRSNNNDRNQNGDRR